MSAPAGEPRPSSYDDTPLEMAPDAAGKSRFVLLPDETLAHGLKRVLIGEIVTSRDALADPTIAPEEAIHRVRRRLKRARSIFYVLAEVPGANQENRAALARDTARLLSGARDADVAAIEARRILARAEGRDVAAAGLLVERLEIERVEAHRALPPLAEVASRLRASEADARSLPERFEAGRLLAEALLGSYRRGRRDWRELGDGFTVETLHDWRKRVKQRRHLSALVPLETAVTTPAVQRDLEDLGEILGEEHDLSILEHRLTTEERLLRPREGRTGIVEFVAHRRRKLAKKALELGEELFGSRTSVFGSALDELRELC